MDTQTVKNWPNKFDNLSGLEFGDLKVSEQWERRRMSNASRTEIYWFCHCSCGVSKWIMGASLKHDNTKTCGSNFHNPSQVEDISGKVFGLWSVSDKWKKVSGRVQWFCVCVCGTEQWRDASNLKTHTTGCGCQKKTRRKYPTYQAECSHCSKIFDTSTGQSKRIQKGQKVYCSRECCRLAKAAKPKPVKKKRLAGFIKKCEACETEFYVSQSHKNRKYCSKKCVLKRIKRICPECGCEYDIKPYDIKNGTSKYCSKKCSDNSLKKRIETNCFTCGVILLRIPSRMENQIRHYCSHKCRRADRVQTPCKECGSIIDQRISGDQQYCSKECADKGRMIMSPEAKKILKAIRSRVHKVLKGIAKSKPTLELLGCSAESARKWIESQWLKGMTWKNHGKNWEIDHIIPCARFDLTQPSEQKACFNWNNLQPLPLKKNRSKGHKLTNPQMSLLLSAA